jgi:hypothetical protein
MSEDAWANSPRHGLKGRVLVAPRAITVSGGDRETHRTPVARRDLRPHERPPRPPDRGSGMRRSTAPARPAASIDADATVAALDRVVAERGTNPS